MQRTEGSTAFHAAGQSVPERSVEMPGDSVRGSAQPTQTSTDSGVLPWGGWSCPQVEPLGRVALTRAVQSARSDLASSAAVHGVSLVQAGRAGAGACGL